MPGRVGRFQVMAVLQSARAEVLGLSEDKAKSWGLNRAIFYAAAKRGAFRAAGRPPTGRVKAKAEEKGRPERTFHLGNEMAYQGKRGRYLWFAIGNEVQTPEDYDRQITRRFGDAYPEAWREALDIVRDYAKETLKSQRGFYEEVYKPRRDDLAQQWSDLAKKPQLVEA